MKPTTGNWYGSVSSVHGSASTLDKLADVQPPETDTLTCCDKLKAALCCACTCCSGCFSSIAARLGYSTITQTTYTDIFAEQVKIARESK
jgi:hypothetical protein